MSAMNPLELHVTLHDRSWRADVSNAHDLSIPLAFDAPQPNFFGAPIAAASALSAGSFVGEVRKGGSCNCATYTLTPHCNGTHTECVGHLTSDLVAIRDVAVPAFMIARVVTVAPRSTHATRETSDPAPRSGDQLITRASIEHALNDAPLDGARALIVRSLPNDVAKQHRQYGPEYPAAYFTRECMEYLVALGIEHLIVDLPSIDRADDEGRLSAHRTFFGLPSGVTDAGQARRPFATVTELAYIANDIADGWYVLNLQLAPFVADAAPSRPLLLPLIPL